MPRRKPKQHTPELVAIRLLKPHPRNYTVHPEDQLKHLGESIRANGVYRNVVTAKDNTILAGHGVVEACKLVGLKQVLRVQLPLDPMSHAALKVLAADNEIAHLKEVDDRALSNLLLEVAPIDGLIGTGYDEMMLANLIYTTRPAGEIADFEAAQQLVASALPGYEAPGGEPDTSSASDAWAAAGMPEYDESGGEGSRASYRIVVSMRTEADRLSFLRQLGIDSSALSAAGQGQTRGRVWSLRWPLRDRRDDWASLKFDKP
jgi:hypothetical protein